MIKVDPLPSFRHEHQAPVPTEVAAGVGRVSLDETVRVEMMSPIRRLGQSLLKHARNRRVDTTVPLTGEEPAGDGPPEDSPEDTVIAAAEESTERPEIVQTLSDLLDPQFIAAEQTSLRTRLAEMKPVKPGETKSREQYKLEYALNGTGVSPYKKMFLEGSDPRAKEFSELMEETPRLEYGTWFGKVFDTTDGALTISADNDDPIHIPLSNVVDANGFASWEGRGREGQGEKRSEHDGVKRTSAQTIELYAGMDSAIPPVDQATAYVQPDGLVFFSASLGAHRAAAAIKRGDPSLAVKELKVHLLDRNLLQAEPK